MVVATSTLNSKNAECISGLVDRRYDQACIDNGKLGSSIIILQCILSCVGLYLQLGISSLQRLFTSILVHSSREEWSRRVGGEWMVKSTKDEVIFSHQLCASLQDSVIC